MHQTLTNLIVHSVFSTKNRAKDLDQGLRSRLWPYMAKVLQNRGCRVYQASAPGCYLGTPLRGDRPATNRKDPAPTDTLARGD